MAVNTQIHEQMLTDQSKTISLFQFIRELNKLKQKVILNTKDYPWFFALSKLPDDPENIKVFYRDRVEDGTENEDGSRENILLSVHKPEFQKCPQPNAAFKEWLLPGWDSYRNEAQVKEFVALQTEEEAPMLSLFDDAAEKSKAPQPELFTDNTDRVKQYESWLAIRSEWVQTQKITERTRNLFADIYRFYFELQRESETEEIIAANGMLCDADNPEIRHPVLTHRVKIEYDADSNTVSIVDTETPSELYSAVFQVMDDVNLSGISTLTEDLQKNDYHPLDRNDTPAFLKMLVRQLSSSSRFSEQAIAFGEKTHSRLLLYLCPCFIVRKRLDGTLKAIERVIEDVQVTGDVPKPIRDIVSGGTIDIPEDIGEAPIEERLAAVGGESVDILLSKEANKEQLDIAKRIEHYNAVLVQGPPGTGKTHTIANLMGHFLAQGKSVLVTSYTKKALSVLKEKVAPGLRDLCVSMLDDSNVDMERSVDGITSYTSRTTSFEVKREMDSLAAERRDVISRLADVRKKIYAIIHQECSCIVLNGEDISPSKAAEFVVEHTQDLSYIPGRVRLYAPLPLSFEQLSALYRSNEGVTAADESELEAELPDPADIMTPGDFAAKWEQYQHMVQCQNAVPCWIMPINKALEILDPRANKFDVVIIDEASQSDISSLAILYMGKKLVIVGDDRQVSPMAVGVEDKKIASLQEQYIKDKIPNAHLYTAKTSIYDVAKTTFQPLMLREHFRCVPEIIGFSNMLSYNGKVKPLRDASNSVLLPAVVNYRVADGQRDGKTNPQEAETIVALMQACFEQPEYAGKSFGVISLLGDEQVKLIQQKIERSLKPQDIIGRNILCGNSANFQGDERDVIFLSLVDSGMETGPIHMMSFGPDDSYRKRYNVAVSRAKDQLWVVDSLDPASDLKPGDIRKTLIDYSLDPKATETTHAEIEKRADSPFEVSVATALSDRGYHLVQQWKVGSYRLDIVAVCGEKKVAIECDGERWHSGEEKIREDMERQTILERLGWRFIRIRGSEFYRDSKKTIERVIAELAGYGIEPEDVSEAKNDARETELLQRVKSRAFAILEDRNAAKPEQDHETIAAALDPKRFVMVNAPATALEGAQAAAETTPISDKKQSELKPVTSALETDAGAADAAAHSAPVKMPRPSVHQAIPLKAAEKKTAVAVAPTQANPRRSPDAEHPKQAGFLSADAEQKPTQKSSGDSFVEELKQKEIQIVDNRKQSGIVWIPYDKDKKTMIESIVSKYKLTASLEKRGAIATGNRPAWRVMI